MKMMNKTSLVLAVATCLGAVSTQTMALVKLSDSTTTVPFAIEQNGESTLNLYSFYTSASVIADGDLTVWLDKMPIGYDVTADKKLYANVALTGGAKFLTEPYLFCVNAVGASGAGGTLSGAVYSGSTAAEIATAANSALEIKTAKLLMVSSNPAAINKSVATFNVPAGITTNASACVVTFIHTSANVLSGTVPALTAYSVGARQNIGMDVTVGYTQAGAATTTTFSGIFIKFVTALKAVITAQSQGATAAASVTIDVKQASKKFAAGGIVDATVGLLGSVTIASGSARLASATAANAADIMSTGSITISGPLLAGVASVGVYSGVTTRCSTDEITVVTPTVASGSGGSVTTMTLSGITVASLLAGVDVCAKVNGTTTLNNGQITASLMGGGVSNFSTSFADGNFVNVDINGTRVRILNIPAVGNADQPFIRFYNTSTQSAVVRGTLYGQDGKVIGTENVELFNPLSGNDVEVLDAAKLATKVGATAPWTGRAWLLVQAELDPSVFKIQGLVRTPSNVLINLSTDAFN